MSTESRHALFEQLDKAPMLPDIMLPHGKMNASSIDDILSDALHTIRLHLNMDVAFVSEFIDGRRFFRHIDSANGKPPISVGASDPLEESYCYYIANGRLPKLMQNAALVPLALTMPATTALPVGAHISVPIYLSDGRIYGTFCCFKSEPDPTLLDRDLALVKIFADFAGKQLERHIAANRKHDQMAEQIKSVIEAQNFSMVYQPIFDFVADKVVGFEALARFSAQPIRPPNIWFDEAAQVGLVEALELAVMTQSLRDLTHLPQDCYLSLNVSPAVVLSGAIISLLSQAPLERIVLEITEHVSIADYQPLLEALAPLREKGARLAVDDAGAGYASFRHILRLEPDMIKLDISLTRDIDTDHTRRALASALIGFAEETGSGIIAEGVETQSELNMLQHLRIKKAQGYLIGRPMPLTSATTLSQPLASS